MEKNFFVKYEGTKDAFIKAKYQNKPVSEHFDETGQIVFIRGSETDGTSPDSCIYAGGMYFGNFTEFLAAVSYVTGVKVGNATFERAGGGYIEFAAGDGHNLGGGTSNTKVQTVSLDTTGGKISIDLSSDFINFVKSIDTDLGINITATQGVRTDLGNKNDTANAGGSAFARIAQLAADVAALGGDSGSIAQQIEAAITAALGDGGDIAMEIENQLDSLEISLMGAGLNGQTDGKVKSAIDAAINKLDGTPEGGINVKVKVTQTDGKVTGVTVDESGLNTALSGKADLANGKITASQLPDYILGQVLYGGTVNATGVATLTADFKSKYNETATTITLSTTNAATYEGAYFIASANGTSGVPSTLGVVTGDWIISNGSAWTKIDNTDAVTSVVGQTGAVTAQQIANAITTTAVGVATKSEVMLKDTFTTGDDDYILLTYTKSNNELVVGASADLVDAIGKAKSAYQKPSAGIPKTDLAAAVQTSLGKADAAAPQSTTYTKTEVDARITPVVDFPTGTTTTGSITTAVYTSITTSNSAIIKISAASGNVVYVPAKMVDAGSALSLYAEYDGQRYIMHINKTASSGAHSFTTDKKSAWWGEFPA